MIGPHAIVGISVHPHSSSLTRFLLLHRKITKFGTKRVLMLFVFSDRTTEERLNNEFLHIPQDVLLKRDGIKIYSDKSTSSSVTPISYDNCCDRKIVQISQKLIKDRSSKRNGGKIRYQVKKILFDKETAFSFYSRKVNISSFY